MLNARMNFQFLPKQNPGPQFLRLRLHLMTWSTLIQMMSFFKTKGILMRQTLWLRRINKKRRNQRN
ncbi:hypothetical protein NC652_035746 [Populus alba x Populus x berolinensis]|nr:hypothetical protein NC652_035746 [Populus alba x Populus x berolinensis]